MGALPRTLSKDVLMFWWWAALSGVAGCRGLLFSKVPPLVEDRRGQLGKAGPRTAGHARKRPRMSEKAGSLTARHACAGAPAHERRGGSAHGRTCMRGIACA